MLVIITDSTYCRPQILGFFFKYRSVISFLVLFKYCSRRLRQKLVLPYIQRSVSRCFKIKPFLGLEIPTTIIVLLSVNTKKSTRQRSRTSFTLPTTPTRKSKFWLWRKTSFTLCSSTFRRRHHIVSSRGIQR